MFIDYVVKVKILCTDFKSKPQTRTTYTTIGLLQQICNLQPQNTYQLSPKSHVFFFIQQKWQLFSYGKSLMPPCFDYLVTVDFMGTRMT